MDIIYTALLLTMMLINILATLVSEGYAFSALLSVINISIACDALFTSVYAEIYFAPWIPLLVLFVAIICMVDGIRTKRSKK